MMDAQDLLKPTGKIHRVNDDGIDPEGQPVRRPIRCRAVHLELRSPQSPGARLGSRERQALGIGARPASGGDEINIIEPEKNYGWGRLQTASNPASRKRAQEGMEQPIVSWTPSVAPSGIVFYTGDKYPGWKNNLFVSCLGGQQLSDSRSAATRCRTKRLSSISSAASTMWSSGRTAISTRRCSFPGRVLSESTSKAWSSD